MMNEETQETPTMGVEAPAGQEGLLPAAGADEAASDRPAPTPEPTQAVGQAEEDEAGALATEGAQQADAPALTLAAAEPSDGAAEPGQPADAGAAVDRPAVQDDSSEITTESVVEAILFATDSPLPANKVSGILGVGTVRDVKKHIASLNEKYERDGASFRIEQVAGGFQMLTLPAYNNWLSKLFRVRRETKLSGAALETLAVVAYKQPALRADIEAVRGVAVGDIINRLREMGLVKIVGRAEVVGRPLLYGTTKKFLEVFGLASLDDLPEVDALALPKQQPAKTAVEPAAGGEPPPAPDAPQQDEQPASG